MSKLPVVVVDSGANVSGGKLSYENAYPIRHDLIDADVLGRSNIAGGVVPITQAVRDALVSAGALGFYSFRADLKNSIMADFASGSKVGTFARADGADRRATVTDFEGLIKTVKSGEARFTGARRVENLLPSTETLVGWTLDRCTKTTGIADPVGGTGAVTITATGASADVYVQPSTSASMLCVSVYARRRTGTGTIQIRKADNSAAQNLTLTSSWQRFSPPNASGSGGAGTFLMTIATSGDEIDISFPQLENVTGQSNQNPSEYVSVGVLSAPYHGAGVDGVKYFTTENGNTVASNVVTEATGAAIADSTLKGYLSEGSRQNLCLQSADFSTTWAAAGGASISTNTAVAPDGTTTADSLIENAVATTQQVQQTFTKAASAIQYTVSCYIKKGGASWAQIALHDNVITDATRAWFNVNTGVVGSTAAVGSGFTSVSHSITAVGNGWYRCVLTCTSNTAASLGVIVYSVDGDGSNLGAGLNGVGLYLWGAQLEAASFASTLIPTTTAAVTRAADDDGYATASNFSDTAGTMYAEFTASSWANASGRIIGDAAEGMLASSANSGVQGYDGTNTVNGTAGSPSGTIKAAISWSGSTMNICVNGGTVATGSYDGAWNLSALGIGNGVFGSVKNVRISQQTFGNATLQAITT